MKRLSVLLDDLAIIRAILSDNKIDPVRFAVLAEHAGANSISCTYINKSKTIAERDLRLLKEMNDSFFNLRIPIDNDAMRMVGRKTESIYWRYAITDEATLKDSAQRLDTLHEERGGIPAKGKTGVIQKSPCSLSC